MVQINARHSVRIELHKYRQRYSNIVDLEADEVLGAENIWIKQSQRTYFNKEFKALKQKQQLEIRSSLLKLNPFMDDDEVMRLSGRIKRSNMPYDTVHPIVLNGKCIISPCYIPEYMHHSTIVAEVLSDLSNVAQSNNFKLLENDKTRKQRCPSKKSGEGGGG